MGHGTSLQRHTHFLFVVVIIIIVIFSSGTNAARYVWRTGRWMECQHNSCGEGGKQFRHVYCTLAGKNNYNEFDTEKCRHLAKPNNIRACFKVCKEHRNDLHWTYSVWSECQLLPGLDECSVQNGVHYRNVTCMFHSREQTASDEACLEFEPKPDTEESCVLKCPQDCIVTEFSPWAESNCDNCLIINKTRTRQLIVPPDPGKRGKSCPPFSEMLPCDNCTDKFTFRIGEWEPCIPFIYAHVDNNAVQSILPRIGYQKRTILCVNSAGAYVNANYCISGLQTSLEGDLNLSQTCIIPQDCALSDWTNWSPHNSTCIKADGERQQGYMVRTRSIISVPLGSGKPCPPLIHYFELAAEEERPCARLIWKMTDWSDCVVPRGSFSCMIGVQTRKAVCVQEMDNGLLKPVPNQLCTERQPVTAQTCHAECDINCALSHWAEWSDCKVNDCELYVRQRRNNEGTGQRYRMRSVLTRQQGNGIPCEHLTETQTCDPQPCYRWNFTVGMCRLLNPATSPTCGLGIAYRTLACVNINGHRVHDANCEELSEKPDDKEDCNIACPGDCILSPWSPWTPCPTICQEGRSVPATQKRDRTVLAQAGHGGASCSTQRLLEEARNCPTSIECAIYIWLPDKWGACEIKDASKMCGQGTQTREVNCYHKQGGLVSDKRCTMKERPRQEMPCAVPCPVDCLMSEFSDWSVCSASCRKPDHNIPIQMRDRHILRNARHGGKPCPEKISDVRNCNNATMCKVYFWKVGDWSACTLPLDRVPQCGQGIQVREVSCQSDNSTTMDIDVCVKQVGPIPIMHQACSKSCDLTCTFDEWSEWSQCVMGCTGKRWRTRKLLRPEIGYVTPKCRDTRFYPRDMYEDCVCATFKPVPLGNWSACILEPENTFRSSATQEEYSYKDLTGAGAVTMVPRVTPSYGIMSVCGPGTRYQVLACQNQQGEVEPASLCSLSSYSEERCLLPCPVDCVMSDWTMWSDCSSSCGRGTKIRYRHIQQVPSAGGRQCPTLDEGEKDVQTIVCKTECQQYRWREYRWDLCVPTRNGAICGNGTQSRSVRCELYTGDSSMSSQLVDDRLCSNSGLFKPHTRRNCYSPCEGECVLSEWAEWSLCRPPCVDPNQVQTRTRAVLRRPDNDPVNACPIMLEERFCVMGSNCAVYRWQTSDWTTCLVNNGSDECGTGQRRRYATCVNEEGMDVGNDKCLKTIGEWTEKYVEECKRVCDSDCLMTKWTGWSDCSNSCDLGTQTRFRDVVQKASGNGRMCPDNMEESKPCFLQGCYTWHVSPWSTCISISGMCGHGVQARNITCMASGDVPVNSTNCKPDLAVSILPLEQSCRVPCPGECVMSDWTSWTQCFIHCKDFDKTEGFTRGIQSRSRAILAYAQSNYDPCPSQLWDSRMCDAESCFTFVWKTSLWSPDKTRTIWCERSDGLRVVGGCKQSERPSSVLSCRPECAVLGSSCNDTNLCVCKDGYRSVYNRLSVLIECINMDNNTNITPVPDSVTLPTDGPTNVWMYAVIGVVTVFVICLAVGCYTMSEFFNKGPRPRRKDEEQNMAAASAVAGLDSVDMPVNHIAPPQTASPAGFQPHVGPRLARPEETLDSNSVTSIDRTPPGTMALTANTVGAPACSRVDPRPMNGALWPLCECLPFCGSRRRASFNDDSPDFLGQPCIMHERPTSINRSLFPPNGSTHVSYCDTDLDIACPNEETHRRLRLSGVPDLAWSDNEDTEDERSKMLPLYSQVNPVRKPERSDQAKGSKHVGFETSVRSTKGKKIINEGKENLDEIDRSDSDEVNRTNVVYLNREASPDIPDSASQPFRRDSFENMLESILDRKLEVKSIEDIKNANAFVTETDKLMTQSETVCTSTPFEKVPKPLDLVQEHEEDQLDGAVSNPLLEDRKRRTRPFKPRVQPPLFYLKSHSLEQSDVSPDKRYDSDDDSIGNAASLMSRGSTMSRMSRLSMTHGPCVKIDPDEAISLDGSMGRSHGPRSPHRGRGYSTLPNLKKINIGYIQYSSIDTENSDLPGSSASCDSLSPRSLPSEMQYQSTAENDTGHKHKMYDTYSEKSFRNVAMSTLHQKGITNHPLNRSDQDSGRGSSPIDTSGSPRYHEQGVQSVGKPKSRTKVSIVDSPQYNYNGHGNNGSIDNGNGLINGNGSEITDNKQYYSKDIKTKRASFKKQERSEIYSE